MKDRIEIRPGAQPKLSDLKPEEHGPVIEISSYYSGHGMSIGSSVSGKESVRWQEDGTVLIEIEDSRNGKDTYEKHLAGNVAAEKLREYVGKSHVAEMAQVEKIPCPFQMTDYSSTSYITFIFDDGDSQASRKLDCGSYWELQSKTISKIRDLIKACIDTGKCLEKTEKEHPSTGPMMGFMSMIHPGSGTGANLPGSGTSVNNPGPGAGEKKPGSWRCSCNYENFGKFCANCGSPRPSGKWKCPNCNTENEGKFCTECGTARG